MLANCNWVGYVTMDHHVYIENDNHPWCVYYDHEELD